MRFDQDVHDYVHESTYFEGEYIFEGWEDMVKAAKERAKQEKGTGKFDKKTTSTGTVYTRKYNQDSGETEEPEQDAEGNEPLKRGRGRPRKNPVAASSDAPKRGRGRPRKNPLPDPNAPKRGRGRPKKVREWIETLRFVAEGFKMRLSDIGGKLSEGYRVVPGFDREKYQERQGLEGPFHTKSGKVVYYDKVEGKYYDPDTDMYIEYDDWKAMNEAGEDTFMSALKGLKTWQVVIMNNYYRGKYSDYSGRYYYVLASDPSKALTVNIPAPVLKI